MNSEIQKLNATTFEIAVVVPRAELREKEQEVFKALNNTLTIPGFRKGKAPYDVFMRHHQMLCDDELIKKCVPQYCEEAVKAHRLELIDYPSVRDIHLDKDSLRFTAAIETKPEVKLEPDQYKHMRINVPEDAVKEQEVDKAIENLHTTISGFFSGKLSGDECAKFSGYPTEAKLRDAVRAELLLEKLKRNRLTIEEQIISLLLKNVSLPVPESVLKKQVERLIAQEIAQLQARGVSGEEAEKHREDIKKRVTPLAEKRVKIYYIMEKIIALEGIAMDTVNDVYGVGMGILLRHAEWGT